MLFETAARDALSTADTGPGPHYTDSMTFALMAYIVVLLRHHPETHGDASSYILFCGNTGQTDFSFLLNFIISEIERRALYHPLYNSSLSELRSAIRVNASIKPDSEEDKHTPVEIRVIIISYLILNSLSKYTKGHI
ncbi:hypothetical protein LAD77_29835 [Klebsiella pneumoniae]|nr:hypothetical protein [Klebsiella pneumoniae]